MAKLRREYMMAVLLIVLIVAVTLTVVTAVAHESSSSVMMFLIQHHVSLMLVLVFVSIGFGYFWALLLQGELRKEQKDTKRLLEILSQLLHADEQLIIRMLVERGGKVSQNDISRHEQMTRVKAHRTVQALKQRGVVHTEKQGKVVMVHLDEPILQKIVM